MKKLICIITLYIYCGLLFSTEQIRDKLIQPDGTEYNIYHGYPLREFFKENPELYPDFGPPPTNLWRGYIAYFKLGKDALYLIDIVILDDNYPGTKSVLQEVFPDKDIVLASWFTGFIAFRGKHEYFEYKIEDGIVIRKQSIDHYHDYLVLEN